MQQIIIKAMIILSIAVIFTGLLMIRFHDCEGDYCPSTSHAKIRLEKLTNKLEE